MGITRYGNAGKFLPIDRMKSPIDRMTVSPDTNVYVLRLLGKILFVIVLQGVAFHGL